MPRADSTNYITNNSNMNVKSFDNHNKAYLDYMASNVVKVL